jgi:DNA invertase Pin-like site-specific DNA recombinase
MCAVHELIDTVYELADHRVTVYPVESQAGPINSTIGKLLWASQAWFAEMENEERSKAVQAGQARARAAGRLVGRPRVIFDREEIIRLIDEEGRSWNEITGDLGISSGSVRRAYRAPKSAAGPCQDYGTEGI